jgi:hypothetical protein
MNSPHFNGDVPESIRHLLIDKEGTKMSTVYNSTNDHLGIHKLAKLHNPENADDVTSQLAKVHGYTGALHESVCSAGGDELIHDEDYAPIHQKQSYSFE